MAEYSSILEFKRGVDDVVYFASGFQKGVLRFPMTGTPVLIRCDVAERKGKVLRATYQHLPHGFYFVGIQIQEYRIMKGSISVIGSLHFAVVLILKGCVELADQVGVLMHPDIFSGR